MIRIVACGKAREKWMKAGIEEYAQRIRPYEKLELVEVQDEKVPQSNSAAENEIAIRKEGERLLRQVKDDEYVILLDLAGDTLTSVGLSEKIRRLRDASNKIVFVIGGSLGVSRELAKRADFRWKLSDCTFPHQLCRILVLEQVYRSFRIINNDPYHK